MLFSFKLGPAINFDILNSTSPNFFFFRYDPESDSWSAVAPMLMPRGGVGLAGLRGYLYAVGGNDGAASLQSVERYNPHTNKWSRVAPMNRRRAGVIDRS